jgi:triosephosphate isomerase
MNLKWSTGPNWLIQFPCCSAEMLVNLQVPWVILGHSERRALLSESNDVSALLKF